MFFHIDEKWFYLVKDGGRYIVAADEVDPPLVSVAHKSHITKVMFLFKGNGSLVSLGSTQLESWICMFKPILLTGWEI
jgi:hypothetical protein